MVVVWKLAVAFLASVFGGWIGTISGGNGLVMIPALIFLGLPPQVAVGTLKFSSVGLSSGGAYKYWNEGKTDTASSPIFIALGVVGAIIGANILLQVSNALLENLAGVLILALLPVVIFKSDIGTVKRDTSYYLRILGYLVFFVVMIYSGFFGAAGGTLTLYTLLFFFGYTLVQSQALLTLILFFLSIASLTVFIIGGVVNYLFGPVILVGGLLGGYLGAKTAVAKGNSWVKAVLAVVVIASAIKLLFF